MPTPTPSIIEEEQKNPEANTPAESSKPVLAASSSSNHPFFSEKAKTLSIQERVFAVKMNGLESQQQLIKSLVELAKNYLIDVEKRIENDSDLGNKKAIANCMSFVKGKIQALHTTHIELFPNNSVNFNQLCMNAIAICGQYEVENGAAQIINYIKRQAVTNSLLGTIETIEAAFNTGFMNLTVDEQGKIGSSASVNDDQGKMESPTNCLAGCSLM